MLTGITLEELNQWKHDRNLSHSYAEIIKRIDMHNEYALTDLLTESRNNIGVIAILNHRYNWSNQTIIHEHRLTTNSDKQSLQSKYIQYLTDNTDNKD